MELFILYKVFLKITQNERNLKKHLKRLTEKKASSSLHNFLFIDNDPVFREGWPV
jgi:hypothetical protein